MTAMDAHRSASIGGPVAGAGARIVPLASLAGDPAAVSGIEAAFWETAATRQFPTEEARARYRETWLGRYLAYDMAHAFVALGAVAADAGGQRDGRMADGNASTLPDSATHAAVIGYLVGCLENPALTPRFADIGYFAAFAPLCERYPAHLHINLTAAWRGQGVGAMLIEAFCGHAREQGAPGVHVVTGRGLRNFAFYRRLDFRERGSTTWRGHEVVLLGREL